MLVRPLAILVLLAAPLAAGDSPDRRLSELMIVGHWKLLHGQTEYFLRKDGRLIIQGEAGLITNHPWNLASVDMTDEAVTILIDPGPSQRELTLRYDSKRWSMMVEEYKKTPQGIRRSAVTWERLGSMTEPDQNKPNAKPASSEPKPPAARDLPPEQALLGSWDTLGGNALHFFGPSGRYSFAGCTDITKEWSIIERTEKEKEQGIMRIRTDVEYRLHFATDGRSILCETFNKYPFRPHRVAQTWLLVKDPARPADAQPAAQLSK